MSTTKTLPPELLERVLFWALATNPRAQYLNLLLTNRAVNQTTRYVANKSAFDHVEHRYGSLAASLFTYMPDQNLLRWLRQITTVAEGVEKILEAARPRLERLQQSGQQNLAVATTTPTSDLSNVLPTLKLGLYIMEAIQFHSDPTPDKMRQLLADLPPYAVLTMRMASILVAALFGNFMYTEIHALCPGRAREIGLVGNDSLMIRGIELELLANGCQAIVDLITPKLPMPEARYYRSEDGTYLTQNEWQTSLAGRTWVEMRHVIWNEMMSEDHEVRRGIRKMTPEMIRERSDYHLPNPHIDIARKDEYDTTVENMSTENSKRETAKKQSIKTLVRGLHLAHTYGWMGPGRFQAKLKTVVMSRRITERFGEALPLYSARAEDISELQVLIATEVGEKTEFEVLQEMKAVIET